MEFRNLRKGSRGAPTVLSMRNAKSVIAITQAVTMPRFRMVGRVGVACHRRAAPVRRASARMAFDAALRQLWAMMSPSPGLELKVADSGASGGRPKAPGNRPTLPTLRPGARKRGLHRPRRIAAPFRALSVVLQGLKQSHAHRSSRGGARRRTRCFTTCGFVACYGSVKKM